jgi:hypothetical protein
MTRDSNDSVSQVLRNLPVRMPPSGLRTSLRQLAARERQRLISRHFDWRQIEWQDRFHLFVKNLMRPLALPFAGGIFSTVALFSMCLGPMYPMHTDDSSDIHNVLTTAAAVKLTAPFGGSYGEVVVDVTVDEFGRMVDYKIVSGFNVLTTEQVRRSLENKLIFTEFKPVTQFGQPTSGKLRISFRNSEVDVKG